MNAPSIDPSGSFLFPSLPPPIFLKQAASARVGDAGCCGSRWQAAEYEWAHGPSHSLPKAVGSTLQSSALSSKEACIRLLQAPRVAVGYRLGIRKLKHQEVEKQWVKQTLFPDPTVQLMLLQLFCLVFPPTKGLISSICLVFLPESSTPDKF